MSSTTDTSENPREEPPRLGEEGPPLDRSSEPLLPRFGSEPHDGAREMLAELRRFHATGPGSDTKTGDEAAGVLPALLHPYRDVTKIRHEFPLFIAPAESAGEPPHCRPLSAMLDDAVSAAAIEGDGRVLRDNLTRVERWLRAEIGPHGAALEAEPLLAAAGHAVQDELALGPESRERLEQDFAAMLGAVPANGRFLAHGEHAPHVLLLLATRARLAVRREDLRREIGNLSERLRSLLEIERRKDPDSHRPEALEGSVGSIGSEFVDSRALAGFVGGHRGSDPMDPQRRVRLEDVLGTLESYVSTQEGPLLTFVHDGTFDESGLTDELGWTATSDDDPCAAAAAIFDRRVARFADVFRAVRVARLEIESRYDATRHGPWLEAFDWRAFSPEELLLLPLVVVLDSGERLAGEGLQSLSELLLSGRRVQIIATRDPAEHPSLGASTGSPSFQLELAYLAVGFREVLVQQSSAARPAHLLQGFLDGIDSVRPSLHVVDAKWGGAASSLDAWLVSGAGIEARGHPLFRYDPERGESWARRFDFSANPEPESDWPVYSLPCRVERGEDEASTESLSIAFTYADFALIRPELRSHFRPIPDSVADKDILPLADYLALAIGEIGHRVPFVWAVDANARVRRLAVTWRLAAACRERRGFWHTLQELAGIHNEYVSEATRRLREEIEQEVRGEREHLEAAHTEEIAKVRGEAVAGAMEGLARSLLDLEPRDPVGLPSVSAPAARPPTGSTAVDPAAKPPGAGADAMPAVEEEPEVGVVSEEPWIDTPLCTSCNDCLQINPLVFVYDANKQARIGDARAGTFAQLVRAAEKCPARCIHPGRPLNPDEPGLDKLIRRAQPFA